MAHTVTLAHDIICPWCWIGFFQAQKLVEEFHVNIDWVGYELFPDELEWPDHAPAAVDTKRPVTPTRMELAWAAQGMEAPTAERPKKMRSHNVLETFEFAKTNGVVWPVAEILYRGLWEQGKNINDPAVLVDLVKGHLDPAELKQVLAERRYKSKIVAFDDDAYAAGIYNVPTFVINDVKYAEQPYATLRKAVKAWVG